MKTILIGRVIKYSTPVGHAEFTPQVRVSDFIYYRTETGRKVLCQVITLQASPQKGFRGKFTVLDISAALPKIWDNLYLAQQKMEGYIEIGITEQREAVRFRVNPFFRHTLVAGKTGKGKTHVQIVMAEEFLKHHIPSIVIDTQGELVHLKDAVVTEDLDIEDLLSHLRDKRTVVYNLQGLSNSSKAQRCFAILSGLKEAKDQDYVQAGNDIQLLQIPPVIVNIDEAEIYCPTRTHISVTRDSREVIIDLAKRGGKLGIGLIMSVQRLRGFHYEARSQCNNAMTFHISDDGSLHELSRLPYITGYDLKRVKNLPDGQCIVTGELVSHPTLVLVRDITTKRAKDLNFEKMLGLTPLLVERLETSDVDLQEFQAMMKKGLTFEDLASKFPTREIPIHGKCIVIPERYFNPDWKNTLGIQGCKVVHCPDMMGGSCYLVRRSEEAVLEKVKAMAREDLPRDRSKRPYH